MPPRRSVLKPDIVTWIVYVSAGTLASTTSPLELVNASGNCVPRVSLIRTTAAPGMTPPWGSLTVPVTAPVVNWAAAGMVNVATASAAAPRIWSLLLTAMDPPPFSVKT